MKNKGLVRYNIEAFLFVTMMGLVLKMFLRIVLNVKYIMVTPWINF